MVLEVWRATCESRTPFKKTRNTTSHYLMWREVFALAGGAANEQKTHQCSEILVIMFKLYIYNKIGAEVHEDELCIGKSDIKYFYEETCPTETKCWLVPTGEEPIRITRESYEGLRAVFFKE